MWAVGTLSDDLIAGSLEVYDEFCARLGERLDQVAARGPFVLLDVHSYNHRRDGSVAEPEPLADNPMVNLGMFLVGLDIVGSKLMEINVFSPGGLGSAQSLYDVNFAPAIIEELERKVNIRRHYPEIDNQSLATS